MGPKWYEWLLAGMALGLAIGMWLERALYWVERHYGAGDKSNG